MAVVCSRRDVSEVRVCLNKDLDFIACGQKVVDRCRDRDAALSADVAPSQPRRSMTPPATPALPPAPAPAPASVGAPLR